MIQRPVWFKDEGHAERFAELCRSAGILSAEVPPGGEGLRRCLADYRTYGVALYLLAALPDKVRTVQRFLSPEDGLDAKGLIAASGPWSSGERAMVRLAAHILHATAHPYSAYDCLDDLDGRNFRLALEALKWRHWRENEAG